ncbi:MAG: hypothetical protein RLZZ628_1144 [Bacteroidota bacterium]|jgi:hypothetical protein
MDRGGTVGLKKRVRLFELSIFFIFAANILFSTIQLDKMKHFHHWAILSIFLCCLCSCGTTRQLTSNRKLSEIDKVLIFKPFSRIDTISSGNRGAYSEEDSEQVSAYLLESAQKAFPQNIRKEVLQTDSHEWRLIQEQITQLVLQVEEKQKIIDIPLSDKMIDILNKYNYNFALGAFHVGFTRSRRNYAGEIAKSIGIGILTLGLVVPIPIKSSSTLICFLVDKQNKNIAFYRKRMGQDWDPTDKKKIDRQINYLLMPYLQPNLIRTVDY